MASEVGSAYVSIYPDTSDFSDKLAEELGANSIVKAMNNAGEAASKGFESGFSSVTVAIGNLLSDVIRGAVDFLGQNLQRGIERLDTIQNFPKLMQTFGYTAEEAADSVLSIQEHLDGLPGSTDEVLRLVQAISDSTGSLELATSTGLAFNDMLTASGADAHTAMYATRMFDQMLGGAAYSAQRWMGIVSKMPLQMGMVAEYMLGAGATTAQLGDALKDGEITMQELAQAMTDLSPQFEIQARAMSYGVGTAMRNFSNRMGMGMAAILDAIGQTRIADTINDISYGIRDAMVWAAGGVEWLRRVILTSGIGVLLGEIGDKLKAAFMGIDWEPVKQFFRDAIKFVHDCLQWILDNGDIVKSVLVGIGVAITAMGIIGIITNLQNALFGASGLITMLTANPFASIVIAVGAVVAALVYFFTETERGKEIWAKFMEVISGAVSFIGDAISTIADFARVFLTAFVNVIIDAASFIWNAVAGAVEGVIAAVQSVWGFLVEAWNAGSALLGIIADYIMNLFAAAFDFIGNIVMGFVDVFNGVVEFVDWVLDGVIAVVAAVVDAVVKGAKSFISDVKNTISKIKSLWDGIRTWFKNLWEKIKSIFSKGAENATSPVTSKFIDIRKIVYTVMEAIKSAVTNAWNAIKTVTSTVMNAIKGIVEPIWNSIKAIIEGVVKLITSIVKGDFEGMKSAVSTIFNGIKSLAESIWNGIKTTITTVVDGIKTAASTAWNGMKTTASTIWNGIKSAATTAWEGIKGAITAPIDAAKSAVSTIMSGMQGIINKLTGKKVDVGVNDSRTAVSNIVNGIQNKINGLKGKTVTVNVQKGGINGIDINAKAAGGGWYMTTYAAGGIATRATAGIFGEAGDEAIIPLSNRNKVRPFARAVATEIDVDAKGGVMVTGNNFYVRNDNDIDRIAEAINRQGMRQMAGRL